MTLLKLESVPQPVGQLLSEAEVMDLLGLRSRKSPRSSLKWLMRTRRLAYYRLAKGVHGFSREDVDRFLADRRVPTRAEESGTRGLT
jgi:hypothetical protein